MSNQTSISNFAMASRINDIAGKPFGNPNEFHLPEFIARLRNQARLIQSELNETIDKGIAVLESLERDDTGMPLDQEAFQKAVAEVRDGTFDMLFTSYGMGHLAGFNVDADFHAGCISNLTKFDRTAEDAELTRQKYAALGLETYILESVIFEEKYYITRSAKDQELVKEDGSVDPVPVHKWLKSVNFKEPEYTDYKQEYSNYCSRKDQHSYDLKVARHFNKINDILTQFHTDGMTKDQPVDVYANNTIDTDLVTQVPELAAYLVGLREEMFGAVETPSFNEWMNFANSAHQIGGHVDYRPIPNEQGFVCTRWRINTNIGFLDVYAPTDVEYDNYTKAIEVRDQQIGIDIGRGATTHEFHHAEADPALETQRREALADDFEHVQVDLDNAAEVRESSAPQFECDVYQPGPDA